MSICSWTWYVTFLFCFRFVFLSYACWMFICIPRVLLYAFVSKYGSMFRRFRPCGRLFTGGQLFCAPVQATTLPYTMYQESELQEGFLSVLKGM